MNKRKTETQKHRKKNETKQKKYSTQYKEKARLKIYRKKVALEQNPRNSHFLATFYDVKLTFASHVPQNTQNLIRDDDE
jgi:hypothetical protein